MVYQEIIEGCSRSPKGFFVKHLCELEQIELTRKRQELIKHYITEGIPTEEERLKVLEEEGEWTKEKEGDIIAYRQTIADNEKMLLTVIEQMQPKVKEIIEGHKKSLIALFMEKKIKLGTTAENMTERDMDYFMAYLTIFKDRACKEPMFTAWEEFENMPELKINDYMKAIDDTLIHINELNIRRISCMPFFLNPFSYCKESIHTFLNKPVSQLTNYQVHLFSLGSRNLNLMAHAEGSPPEYQDNVTADDIIKWYDIQYSVLLGKRKAAASQNSV